MYANHLFFRNNRTDIIPVIHQFHTIKALQRCCKIFHRRITLQIPFHTCYIKLCFHPLPNPPIPQGCSAFLFLKTVFHSSDFFCASSSSPDQTILRTRLFQITLPQPLAGQFHLCVNPAQTATGSLPRMMICSSPSEVATVT